MFDVTDLQDPEQRCGSFTSTGKRGWDAEKRLKSVCVTLYWIGRKLAEEQEYQGPLPDLSVFHPVLPGQAVSYTILSIEPNALRSPSIVNSLPFWENTIFVESKDVNWLFSKTRQVFDKTGYSTVDSILCNLL